MLAFSPDGSLLAEGRRSWVTLWDLRDPAAAAADRRGASTGGDPTALAVLDDGRVLSSGSAACSRSGTPWATAAPRTIVPGRTERRSQHLDVDSAGQHVLIDSPSASTTCRWSTSSPAPPSRASGPSTRTRPRTSLPPISWTTEHGRPTATLVAAFDLAGRGFVFDTADGHLLTGLSGGHTSLVSEALSTTTGQLVTASVDGTLRLWDPRAARAELSDDLSDDLCRVFGGRIDEDSWRLAFGDDDFDPPCPAAELPAPRAAARSQLGRRGRAYPRWHAAHRGASRTPSTRRVDVRDRRAAGSPPAP